MTSIVAGETKSTELTFEQRMEKDGNTAGIPSAMFIDDPADFLQILPDSDLLNLLLGGAIRNIVSARYCRQTKLQQKAKHVDNN